MAATAVVVGGGTVALGVWIARSRTPPAIAVAPESMAPEGVRVRVQVVNASTVRGLARRATTLLRDRGFDVVEAGTGTGAEQIDSTLVLDRSGHPDWAKRVAAAMGGARMVARPDSSRYVDVTVFVGRTWRPPPQPFYP
ncbi:MAG: LytR C-terminal domain-containing protein [Gemmatimonadota bacterium]